MQALWMLFASFVFAVMGVCVKLASGMYSVSELVMYRGLIGMLFLFALVRYQGGSFKTSLPWQHVWRGTVGVTALWLWFYSISLLPLATAMTLNYMSSIWIAAILFVGGWWSGKSRFEWRLTAAITLSFIGVTMLLRPSIHPEQWVGGVIALFSGFLSALAYMQVRHLGQLGEPEYRVVFYFSFTGVVAGLLGAWIEPGLLGRPVTLWRPHSGTGIALLLAIGITATTAQMAMTRAFRLGNPLVTANLQYTGIVFSSVFGILIWNDVLGLLGWLGIGVILVSGILATFYNMRNTPSAKTVAVANPIATEI
jgi:S-adenosylmethionine uptake transporter